MLASVSQRWHLTCGQPYAQEYLAEFVDWAGVGFFAREKLLKNNQPIPYPTSCEFVFAIIDTASKTGTDNNRTAVTFFACDRYLGRRVPLMILDSQRVHMIKLTQQREIALYKWVHPDDDARR
jgi:hypothetical protein